MSLRMTTAPTRTDSTLGRLRLELGQLCSVERHLCILSSSSATFKSNSRVLPLPWTASKRERSGTRSELYSQSSLIPISDPVQRQQANTNAVTIIIVHILQDNSQHGTRSTWDSLLLAQVPILESEVALFAHAPASLPVKVQILPLLILLRYFIWLGMPLEPGQELDVESP